MMNYVIAGAAGNTGSKIANLLLKSGNKIRVIGRNAKKLKPFTDKGAEAFTGEIQDDKFLTEALKDSDALYALIPPDYTAPNAREYQNKIADSYCRAIKNSGIKYVVALSSVGVHVAKDIGIIQGLYDMEQKFDRLEGVNVIFLRAGYFMENYFGYIGLIKSMGVIGSGLRPDLLFPNVATVDIAEMAVKYLRKLDFSGKEVQFVFGPRDVTPVESAKILGVAIGKPDLKYVQFPYEDVVKTLMGYGFSEDSAKGMTQMVRKFNEDILYKTSDRNADNTTKTTLEEFSKTFATVYNAQN